MILKIRKFNRPISKGLLLTILFQLGFTASYALTSGPSQPETKQFAPAGMDDMVDPFTGDFSYNIPLMDVGGYPININYAAGIEPDAEASWVGLGWNLNVGAINRSMRGLPDDFAGDEIEKQYSTKPNQTFGVNGYVGPEIWGIDALKLLKAKVNASIFYNNYNGYGMTVGMNPSLSSSLGSKGNLTANLGLNLSIGSEDGVGITPTLGIQSKKTVKDMENTTANGSFSLSFPYSSREGLKGMSMGASFGRQTELKQNKTGGDGKESMKTVATNGNSASGSAYIGFAAPSYTPFIQNSTYSVNVSADLAVGYLDNTATEPDFGVSMFYNGQFLKDKIRKVNGYGYLHSGLAYTADEEKRLMDFNREKEGAGFNKYTVAMPLANHTYDVFNVSGQGVGGTYRAFRGDVGTVSDMAAKDLSISPELGLELSFGAMPNPTVKPAFHFKANVAQGYSGTWQNGGRPRKYTTENDKNTLKESVYFKRIGEMAPEADNDFLMNGQFGYDLVNNELAASSGGWLTQNFIQNNGASSRKPITKAARTIRQPMNTRFTSLTASEVSYPIENYELNTSQNTIAPTPGGSGTPPPLATRAEQKLKYKFEKLPRLDNNKKGHHFSEIKVTDNSGSRYVYGIPVYNNIQEEMTFNLNHKGLSESTLNGYRKTGLSPYNKSDVGIENRNGLDHYYSKTTTPAYATSFLLSQILSSDYVDSDAITGPSDGDLGNYTKFNYSKTSQDFRWRTPFDRNKCSFNDGMYGTTIDNKGSIVYGEKEIWYLHSVETRTHVAEFYLEDRMDGLGVSDKEGGNDVSSARRLKCLKKIILYSKQDKLNGKNEPLKTVYFDYDYSLCKNTPNSIADTKGKLTLKKIWFTYGNSQKGVLNPYVFKYAEDFSNRSINLNPDYNIKNYDKWGNYKSEADNPIGNEVFPFVEQNVDKATINAAVYNLSSIKVPTGGTIRVYYESDDYGYVQDKQAMEMCLVEGVSATDIQNISNLNRDEVLGLGNHKRLCGLGGVNPKNYLVLKLNQEFKPVNPSNINQEFASRYLKDIDLMFMKSKVRVLGNIDNRYEFVPAYLKIVKSGCHPIKDGNNKYTYAVIKLDDVSASPKGGPIVVNSLIRSSLSFLKLNLNRESFGSGNAEDSGIEQQVKSILSIVQSIASFVAGYNTLMLGKDNCTVFDPGNSYAKLSTPYKTKLGGGHRVKAIVMLDNWGLMKSKKEKATSLPTKESAYYGQFYDYTKLEDTGLKDIDNKPFIERISSGVAAYEPQIGGEENPWRKPIFVEEKALLGPSKEFFLEEPFGESFFPGPTVGYSKVRTIPMKVTESELITKNFVGNGSGYVEQEFYTNKDFPTIVKRSNLNAPRFATPIKVDFIISLSEEIVSASQGFYIENNDMHGKQKSKKVMPDPKLVNNVLVDSEPISYVEYVYRTDNKGQLNNRVPFVNSDLSINTAGIEMGIDVDVTMDERYTNHEILGGGAEINPKVTVPAPPAPLVLVGLTIIPSWIDNYSEFKSIVTTKVICRHAILEKTIAKDNGQTITTENLAWDKETGQVLLTKVDNEFHDPIWNFTYPGHWAYDIMRLGYRNEGLLVTSLNRITNGTVPGYLPQEGDEWIVKTDTDFKYIYLVKTSTGFSFMLKDGTTLPATTIIKFAKLYRSGYRNMAETPVGSIATLDDPVINNKLDFTKVRVLNAGATQFKPDWKVFCNCGTETALANPYTQGSKGNIRPWKSWTYLTNRVQQRVNDQTNIRKDGYFTDYRDFWNYNSLTQLLDTTEILNRDNTKWQYVTQIENYNPVGMEIENQDALGRFSMAQFGYGRNLPVGTSNNSKYQETGYDGFEDYDYGDCKDDHFSWRPQAANLSEREAHTGRKSIKVAGGKTLLMNKIIDPCNVDNTTNSNNNLNAR